MNILQEYQRIRNQTTSFCAHLHIEDYSIQVAKFASPVKWHLAHTTWFFETFLLKASRPSYKVFDDSFSFLFNSYYNNLGDRIVPGNRGNLSRPATEKIYEYRNYVDTHISTLLQEGTDQKTVDLIILGLNHEQQHQELLKMDVKYMFGSNPLYPVFHSETNLIDICEEPGGMMKIASGIHTIGHAGDDFCFDNELGKHQVYIESFEINKSLVTNGEYLAFIEAGGYYDFNLWLDDGWSWINQEKIDAPLYWQKMGESWHYYTLSGLKKINLKAPVCHVSYFEACAFAAWKELRLPTEFEWEVASKEFSWGKRWEWTNSAYLPYPGFEQARGAVGEYNGKFMSNKMVLRGASVATPEKHSRRSYRNFFQLTDKWQFSGIRLAK